MTLPVTPFRHGDTTSVPDHLNSEFSAVGDAIAEVEQEFADGNLALHGTGTELAAGLALAIGTGLSVRILNEAFWLSGRRYEIDEAVGYLVSSLPLNSTRHLYMDASFAITDYASRQTPNPAGTWYMGTATTNASACTAVDDSNADRVANLAGMAARLVSAEADVDALQAAVGIPYSAVDPLDDRVTALENAGPGGAAATWGAMAKAAGDPTTVDQEIAAAIAAIPAPTGGTGDGSTTVSLPWDIEAANQGRMLLKLTRTVDPELPVDQVDCICIVNGVWGDGTDGSPDFIDRVHSTW
jgi:hypothetical protein